MRRHTARGAFILFALGEAGLSLLVVGSVALDSIETPHGSAREVLGGSAVYCAYAASFLTDVHLVGVVGEDFPPEHVAVLEERNIDVTGLQRVPGRTFRWAGAYDETMNTRETVSVELNVFGEFEPELQESQRKAPFVFLANGSPVLQRHVLDQLVEPKFVAADTMRIWIENTPAELRALLERVDALTLNDEEARCLTGKHNLVVAARHVQEMGPKVVVVKKGEHGAILVTSDALFVLPAFPTTSVKDPTGAGDAFAGGMMGYMASEASAAVPTLKKAMAYGTVLASFTVEEFSLNRLREISDQDIEQRLRRLQEMVSFS